jgi:hypothetical protein
MEMAANAEDRCEQCDTWIKLLTYLATVSIKEYPELIYILRQKCRMLKSGVSELIADNIIDFDKGVELVQLGDIILEQTKSYDRFEYNE